jgi:aminopeptidase YwaD
MSGRRLSGWLSFSIPLVFLLVLGCSDSSDAERATATPPSEATSAAQPPSTPMPALSSSAPAGAITPDGNRIHGYVRDLAETIGIRAPGSAAEKAAADYLAVKLRSFGYEVQLQDFPISNEASRTSTLTVSASEPFNVTSVPFENSAAGTVSGALIAVKGTGAAGDFPANTRGNIALIERGDLQFRDKIANAASAGATGVIIFNNEPGALLGTLGDRSAVPAVAISQAEGQRLLDLLARGAATAGISVDAATPATSYNVVAKPPGRDCEVVSGGHYDSVPAGPGANDNASGTATVLELAAITASKGQMGANCFVLFGSEEIGLYGSRAYVASLTPDARARMKAMLNFDMVGVGDQSWQLIGSASLQDKGAGLASALGIPVVRSNSAGTGAGSDHASFINAGIPALFLHRTQDVEWHQPGDRAGRVQPQHLETAARLGLALIESLAGGT